MHLCFDMKQMETGSKTIDKRQVRRTKYGRQGTRFCFLQERIAKTGESEDIRPPTLAIIGTRCKKGKEGVVNTMQTMVCMTNGQNYWTKAMTASWKRIKEARQVHLLRRCGSEQGREKRGRTTKEYGEESGEMNAQMRKRREMSVYSRDQERSNVAGKGRTPKKRGRPWIFRTNAGANKS